MRGGVCEGEEECVRERSVLCKREREKITRISKQTTTTKSGTQKGKKQMTKKKRKNKNRNKQNLNKKTSVLISSKCALFRIEKVWILLLLWGIFEQNKIEN